MSNETNPGIPRRVADFSSPVDLVALGPHKSHARAIRADTAGTLTIIDSTGVSMNGNIAEVVICDAIPSSGDRASLDAYLTTRYAL